MIALHVSGCKIKALRNKTNTYIKTPTRGEEPVFVITGRREDVATARREILSAADHFSQIRASRRAGGGGSGAVSGPSPSLTALTPTGGSSPGLPAQQLPPSPVSTSSPPSGSPTSGLPPNLSPSKSAVDHSSRYTGGCGGNTVSGPGLGQVTCEVRVPVRVVGLVVGPKGATIKRIQAETGTYIVTPSRGTDPVFEVVGSPDNVERARREIESYIIGNGGAVRGGVPTMASSGNCSMVAGCSIRNPLTPLTDPRRQTGIGSAAAADWRQIFVDNSMVDCLDKTSPTRMPGGPNGRLIDYGSSGMLNFRQRLDDLNGFSTPDSFGGIKTGSKHSGFGVPTGLPDDIGTQLLLLHAAAEAAATNGLHPHQHHQQQQPMMPLFNGYDHRDSTPVDVFSAAEQLLGPGSVSGCPPSPFDRLPPSPNWSQAVRGKLLPSSSPDGVGNPFDMWSSADYSSMSAQSATMLMKHRSVSGVQQSTAEPPSTSSSIAFQHHMALLSSDVDGPSSTMSASSLPWLCTASNAGTRMPRKDDVIGNRWIEAQSSSSSSESSESAIPGSPMTPGIFPSAVGLF